jgi:hypothetical protein
MKWLKILKITPELLADLLVHPGVCAQSQEGLPPDLRIAEVRWDPDYQHINLIVESASFPEVPPGNQLLVISPTFHRTQVDYE